MSDNIHKTHFPVTKEMPWREKEKQAILLFQKVLHIFFAASGSKDLDNQLINLFHKNMDLIMWIKSYK